MAVQGDGRILVSAQLVSPASGYHASMFRLNADGSIDCSFAFGVTNDFVVQQILALPNGQILAGGDGLIRMNADGSVAASVDVSGVASFAVKADGRIVAAGSFSTVSDYSVNGVVELVPELTSAAAGPEFAREAVNISRDAGAVVLPVRRLGDSFQAFTVNYATEAGTARAGEDFTPQQGTLQFAPFQTTNAIVIPILNAPASGDSKTFRVRLSNPSDGLVLQFQNSVVVSILAGESGIEFDADTFSVGEGDGIAEVLVVRHGNSSNPASVEYVTSDGTALAGSDYLARSGSVTFAPGETNRTIRVPILDDGLVEGNETIHLTLSNAQPLGLLGLRTNATLVILDNEIPTAVDPTFDPALNIGTNGSVPAIALQPDGKVVMAVNTTSTNGRTFARMVRLNSDGSMDQILRTFQVTSSLSGCRLQSDGKLLFWGAIYGGIGRMNADGSGDPAFLAQMSLARRYGGLTINSVAVQPDGKILVGGVFDIVDGVAQKNLARLNADGSRDPNFLIGTGFSWINPNSTDETGNLSGFLLQPDGKILVSGGFSTLNGIPQGSPVRLNSDGSVDKSFIPWQPIQSFAAVQSDGRILAQVSYNSIVRLNPDGSSDSSYVTPENFNVALVPGVNGLLQPDDKLLLTDSPSFNRPVVSGLIRLNTDGSLDTTLPSVRFSNNFLALYAPAALALDASGRIIAAGDFASVNDVPRIGAVRLFGNLNGPPDIAFSTTGFAASETDGYAQIMVNRLGNTTGRPASITLLTMGPASRGVHTWGLVEL
jgi:uncharacterized delta-60 repeat protein